MTWDELFTELARTIAKKSKDTTKVGAVIASPDHRVLGMGFNGPPPAMDDTKVPWTRPEKYPYMVHAEDNALWFAAMAGHDLR